ncbi:MAG: CdaR family protein [Deltaproteobacteria bacterium]
MLGLLKKFIFKDFKLKVLSLVLASMLWFAVSYMGESKIGFSVKIGVDKLSKEFIIKKIENEEVLITVEGPVSILKGIRARDIRLTLNLSDAKEGRHVFTLQETDVQTPKGVKVEALKPDFVAIELDRIMEKRLRTIVILDKKWTGAYRIKSWSPQYALVEGSRESLEKIHSIETIPVDGNFMAEEEIVEISLDIKDMLVKRIKPETIKVVLRRQ